MGEWTRKRALIVVRTYPVPAYSGIEVSCTAAITEDGQWLRLFPVPYRFMQPDKKFSKYQWINVSIQKASNDSRPESYKLDPDSIEIESSVSTENQWQHRKHFVFPLKRPSLCAIEREREENGHPTLGIFRPGEIKNLRISETDSTWSSKQRNILNQMLLPIGNAPDEQLEKIPFDIRYEFTCDDSACNGHRLICTDWEMGQSYRTWRAKYGDDWESKLRQKYEHEMINRFDTHFFVGTLHQFPGTWIIVGLFYPPPFIQDELPLS